MGLLIGILANLLGGSTYFIQKTALAAWPPATLILARSLIGLPLIWLTVRRGWSANATRADWKRLVLIGTLGLAAPHLLGVYGLRDTHSLNAAILIGMEPVTIVLMSWLLLGVALIPRQIAGIAAAMCGAALIVVRGDPSQLLELDSEARGNLLLALTGMLWAIYTLAAKPTLERVPPIALTAVTTTISIAALGPASALEWDQLDLSRALAPVPLGCVILLGVGVTYGGTVLWNVALRRISPVQMAALVFLQPIAGAALGLAFGEPLPAGTLAGSVLVLAGVWLARDREPEREGQLSSSS